MPISVAREPQRRHSAVWSGRQALHPDGRQWPARFVNRIFRAARPAVCPGPTVPTTSLAGQSRTTNHLTGFILRLNDDGSTPADNPFFNASTPLTGEAAANIKKLFAYGVRNGFGLAF